MSDKELGLLLDQCQLHHPAGYPHQPADPLHRCRQPAVHLGGRLLPLRERSAARRTIRSPCASTWKISLSKAHAGCGSGSSSRMRSPAWIWRSNSPNDPGRNMRNVNLSVEEWRVVSYINPKNSIRQIARATKMNDLEIRRIVYGLAAGRAGRDHSPGRRSSPASSTGAAPSRPSPEQRRTEITDQPADQPDPVI